MIWVTSYGTEYSVRCAGNAVYVVAHVDIQSMLLFNLVLPCVALATCSTMRSDVHGDVRKFPGKQ